MLSMCKVTVLPASAVPVNVGVVRLVMLSVSEIPESLAGTRSGILGGGMAMTTVIGADGGLKSPEAALAAAMIEFVPQTSGSVVIVHVPSVAMVLPRAGAKPP